MKRLLAVAVFVAVAVLSANVHAQQGSGGQGTGPYIGGHLGVNILSDPDIQQAGFIIPVGVDAGVGLGGVLGYDFGNVRIDGELAFRNNGISDFVGFPAEGNVSALSYMINGYFDVPTGSPLKPYVGGGIGFATVSYDLEVIGLSLADDTDSVMAFQFSAGLGYEVSPRATVSFGYRYFTTEDPEMEDVGGFPFTTEYQSHEFNVGARFMF
ncbi:MAG: outer membrane beta-barrel protein [Nitrospinota bacterium]|nr:outer membrane beta-barrel protein [Nitrospinota bacterium]